jgi:transcription elongation GreA/GreB family factor
MKKTVEELEARFIELMDKPPYAAKELADLLAEAPVAKGGEWALDVLKAYEEAAGDFEGAFTFISSSQELLERLFQTSAGQKVRDTLRKTAKDRLLVSFVDGVGFGARSLREALGRLGCLLSFHPGSLVLSAAWGLGEIRGMDHFYRRVTVDFFHPPRRGHQFTYDAACETLKLAPENHILVTRKADPARVEMMLKDKPGSFVKAMLSSFGDMPVTRLEELCAHSGFVKSADWKKFWERARADLRQDKCVEIPTRRTDPIHLKSAGEEYGDSWFTAFAQMKDPKSILSSVREMQAAGRVQGMPENSRATVVDRLAFALKGARGVDDALYARIAFCVGDLKLDEDLQNFEKPTSLAKARAYLWDKDVSGEERYLSAARDLPARDVGSLVAFLAAENREEARDVLLGTLPRMCFTFLGETIDAFKDDEACRAKVAELLRSPSAPATLVTLVLGRYESFKAWEQLPPLVVILTHAIALGEGRQGGEKLRMQNMIRRLFADRKWLASTLEQLDPAQKALFFERFQASIAWDPSTHHMIVMRMTQIAPELATRLVKKAGAKKQERITSRRSYAERQAAYERLVNVEIPANTKRIEAARSYGDLSENAEYQYAKDEQRVLLQKQTLMQEELNVVKAVDFSDVAEPEAVVPGSSVTVVAADGAERTYTVLGEWDNDIERGVISNKTPLAEALMGKRAGDAFELMDADGKASAATIKAVGAISDEVRAWLAAQPENA